MRRILRIKKSRSLVVLYLVSYRMQEIALLIKDYLVSIMKRSP